MSAEMLLAKPGFGEFRPLFGQQFACRGHRTLPTFEFLRSHYRLMLLWLKRRRFAGSCGSALWVDFPTEPNRVSCTQRQASLKSVGHPDLPVTGITNINRQIVAFLSGMMTEIRDRTYVAVDCKHVNKLR
jgi:hypothetical protein